MLNGWRLQLDSRMMALLIIAIAMGIAGRLAFIWWPNVMLTYFIVAAVAIAYHPLLGALTGALTMLLTDTIVGFTPLSIFTISGMAVFGFVGGVLGRALELNRKSWNVGHTISAAILGAVLILAYSLYTDLGSAIFFIGGGGDFISKYAMVAAAGLVFNIPMIFVNGALFGFTLRPVLNAISAISIGETTYEIPETTT
jgi:uncharacterized membrane protein